MRVIIVHGTEGKPEGNWFPWLKAELEQRGVEVLVPRFPTPEGQNLSAWFERFRLDVGLLRSSDVLVGHSAGASFVCRALEVSDVRIRASFLVAGYARPLGHQYYDTLNQTFVGPPFDWEAIRAASQQFVVMSGENDPYMGLEFGKELAGALCVHHRVIKHGGHLNAESGLTEFPLLLADLEPFL